MKLRILSFVLVLVFAASLMAACGKKTEVTDPMKVAEKYLDALKDSNVKTAVSVNFCRADIKELGDAYGKYWEVDAEDEWDDFIDYIGENYGSENVGEAALKLMDKETDESRANYAAHFGDDYKIVISNVKKGDAVSEELIGEYVADHNDDIDSAIENLNAVGNRLGTDLLGEYRIGDGDVKEGVYISYTATISGSLVEEDQEENGRLILLHVGDGWYVANDNLSPLAVVEQLYYDWQFTQTYEK